MSSFLGHFVPRFKVNTCHGKHGGVQAAVSAPRVSAVSRSEHVVVQRCQMTSCCWCCC
ncbi:hypothetical protein E2C01_099473 [Portunus trituberculatus]|uniref:Uncharacterized protein n=1 Tax=Portunus trituberculatus TaxID=210409 RepID=A0A5B7KFH2_PORTR|nr:hypothetical protein [Portunus trituberculatus]